MLACDACSHHVGFNVFHMHKLNQIVVSSNVFCSHIMFASFELLISKIGGLNTLVWHAHITLHTCFCPIFHCINTLSFSWCEHLLSFFRQPSLFRVASMNRNHILEPLNGRLVTLMKNSLMKNLNEKRFFIAHFSLTILCIDEMWQGGDEVEWEK